MANLSKKILPNSSENARSQSEIFRGPTKKNFRQIASKLTELEHFQILVIFLNWLGNVSDWCRIRHICVGFVSNRCRIGVGSDTFVSDRCRIGVGLVSDPTHLCRIGVGLVSDPTHLCRIGVGSVSANLTDHTANIFISFFFTFCTANVFH